MTELPRITPTTSAMHLGMAKKEFTRATSRKERIEIAEKHKRYMLNSDINLMRAEFNQYHASTSSAHRPTTKGE